MSLISMFKSLQKGFLKNVLTGAGLTLGSAGVSLFAIDTVIKKLHNDLNSVSSQLLNLMALAGIDVAMSIILGAIVTRITMQSGKLVLQKANQ